MADADAPALTDAEIERIGNSLVPPDPPSAPPGRPTDQRLLLLAVSGGVDSIALMHIVAESVGAAKRARILVATVDHALRTESAEEARFVQAEAARIGLEHVTLAWQGSKPATGIQESARAARYQLLANVYHDQLFREKTLVTAHTLDDQAETVLMRLARGSGVAGLSGIEAVTSLDLPPDMRTQTPPPIPGLSRRYGPIDVSRPLLSIPKSRLVATMKARGHGWIEDPSNDDPAFERVRIRKAMPMLAELGITPEAIARSARRINSANHAIREATLRALADTTRVHVDPLGFVDLDRTIWRDHQTNLSEAVLVRVLAAVIRCVGGLARPLSLQSLETLARDLSVHSHGKAPFGTTLGLTKITWLENGVRIQREAGRNPPPPSTLEPGQKAIWDNRFDVMADDSAERALSVQALGTAGVAWLRANGHVPPGVTADVLHMVPSFWDGETMVAAPPVAQKWIMLDPRAAAPHGAALEGRGWAAFRSESLTRFPRGDIED